ncbi:MAG: tetratricopeptide repeat protein [Planctomycetes bacterium]|nr:tetratricopeptide repeat protein [Planctomycetota bacterium]
MNATLGHDDAPTLRWLWLLALTPALVWGCWRAPFSSHDDVLYVKANPLLAPDAPHSGAFTTDRLSLVYGYPLTTLSWRFDRAVWGNLLQSVCGPDAWPAGIRITNLLLHALAAWFVWASARRLGAGGGVAAFAMAGFALHPAACESVCWTVQRKNVLAACLALGALWAYVRARNPLGGLLAILFYAGALSSKPSALGIFPIVGGWELLGRPGSSESRPIQYAWRGALLRLAPWVALTAASVWFGMKTYEEDLLAPPGGTVWTAMLTDVYVLRRYATMLLWPFGLSAYYGIEPVATLSDARLWASVGILAVLVGGSVWLARERRLALFGWGWFVAAMLPTLNLVALTDYMHDRWVYLSAPGFYLALGTGLAGARERMAASGFLLPRRAGGAALVATALLFAAASLERGALFGDTFRLFENAARNEPTSAHAQLFYAAELRTAALNARAAGRPDEAQRLDDAALVHQELGIGAQDLDRVLHRTHARIDLAGMYFERGRYDEAETQLHTVTQSGTRLHREDYVRAYELLGRCALRAGRYDEAKAQLKRALGEAPDSAFCILYLAQTLFQRAKANGDALLRAEAAAVLGKIDPAKLRDASERLLLEELRAQTAEGTAP